MVASISGTSPRESSPARRRRRLETGGLRVRRSTPPMRALKTTGRGARRRGVGSNKVWLDGGCTQSRSLRRGELPAQACRIAEAVVVGDQAQAVGVGGFDWQPEARGNRRAAQVQLRRGRASSHLGRSPRTQPPSESIAHRSVQITHAISGVSLCAVWTQGNEVAGLDVPKNLFRREWGDRESGWPASVHRNLSGERQDCPRYATAGRRVQGTARVAEGSAEPKSRASLNSLPSRRK